MDELPVLGAKVVTSFGDAVVAIVVVETVTQISYISFKPVVGFNVFFVLELI